MVIVWRVGRSPCAGGKMLAHRWQLPLRRLHTVPVDAPFATQAQVLQLAEFIDRANGKLYVITGAGLSTGEGGEFFFSCCCCCCCFDRAQDEQL
jgi:hypothetical protein